jgi:hypothetical protein
MPAVQTRLHQAGTGTVADLGSDHQFRPTTLERPTQQNFALATGKSSFASFVSLGCLRFATCIRVGRVEEIDTGVKRLPDHRIGRFGFCFVNGGKTLIPSREGHGAK